MMKVSEIEAIISGFLITFSVRAFAQLFRRTFQAVLLIFLSVTPHFRFFANIYRFQETIAIYSFYLNTMALHYPYLRSGVVLNDLNWKCRHGK